MTKREYRTLFKAALNSWFAKPQKRWEATVQVWNRGIAGGCALLVTWAAIANNHVGDLILIFWTLALLAVGLYLTAKGR